MASAQTTGPNPMKRSGPMPEYPWFRFYSDLPGSIAVRQLSHFEFRVLVVCYCMANRSPGGDRLLGALTVTPTGEPVPVACIASEAMADEARTQLALNTLESKKMLEMRESDGAYVATFKWQQYPSDNSTARSQKSRRKKKVSAVDTEPSSSLPPFGRQEEQTQQTEQTKGNVAGDVPATLQDSTVRFNSATGEYEW